MVRFLCLGVLFSLSTLVFADPPNEIPLRIELPDNVMNRLDEVGKRRLAEIGELAAKELTVSTGFEVKLPPELLDVDQIVELTPLYTVDPADKVRRAAFDGGKQKPLTEENWETFHEDSIIWVPDPDDATQNLGWKSTSTWRHKGAKAITISLQKNLSEGYRHFVIEIPYTVRFYGGRSVRNVGYALRNTLSLLVGLTETKMKYTQEEIESTIAHNRAEWIQGQISKAPAGSQGPTLDARFEDEKLMKEVLPIVRGIEAKVRNTQASRIQASREAESLKLMEEGVAKKLWPQLLKDRAEKDDLDYFFQAVESDAQLEALSPGLGKPLADHGRALLIVRTGEMDLEAKVSAQREVIVEDLKKESPIRSRTDYLEEKADVETRKYFWKIRNEAYAKIVDLLDRQNLPAYAELVRKSLEFSDTEGEKERDEFTKATVPARTFEPRKLVIWEPKNWIRYEERQDDGTIRYRPQVYTELPAVATKFPWRLTNLWQRSRAAFQNGLHSLLIRNLWNGPLGVRGVFKKKPFAAYYYMDPKTGEVLLDKEQRTSTLLSQLKELNESISVARDKFKKSEPTGFPPKWVGNIESLVYQRFLRQVVFQFFLGAGRGVVSGANIVGSAALVPTSIIGVGPAYALFKGADSLSSVASMSWDMADGLASLPVPFLDSALGLVGLTPGAGLLHTAAMAMAVPLTYLGWAPLTGLIASGWHAAFKDHDSPWKDDVNRHHGRRGFFRSDFRQFSADTPRVTGTYFPLVSQVVGRVGVTGVPVFLYAAIKTGLHALGGAFDSGWGLGQWALESLRDLTVEKIFRWSGAKIPSRIPDRREDSFLALVSGPGVDNGYFYEISPDAALIGIIAELERVELMHYQESAEKDIRAPEAKVAQFLAPYQAFVEGELGQLPRSNPLMAAIRKYTDEQVKQLNDAVRKRSVELDDARPRTLQSESADAPVKMRVAALEAAVSRGAALVEKFYTEKVFPRLSEEDQDDFWTSASLTRGDWAGVALKHLRQAFGKEVLVPYEETATTFRITVPEDGLGKMLETVLTGDNLNLDGKPIPTWTYVQETAKDHLPRISAHDLCQNILGSYGMAMQANRRFYGKSNPEKGGLIKRLLKLGGS